MKFRWEILRLRRVDLISTGEIEITGGIKITSTYGFEIAM
jgi:hypothetical protein